MDEQGRDGLTFSFSLGKTALEKDGCKCWEGVLGRSGKQKCCWTADTTVQGGKANTAGLSKGRWKTNSDRVLNIQKPGNEVVHAIILAEQAKISMQKAEHNQQRVVVL